MRRNPRRQLNIILYSNIMSRHDTSQEAEILSQHSKIVLRQRMRRATKESLELCRNIEMIFATRIILCLQKLARVQCNARKVCHDKYSYVVTNSLEINNTSHKKFVTTKILMSRQTFQRVIRSRHELCLDNTSRDQQSKIANFVATSNNLVMTNLSEIKV